jgi:hypothetical protein
MFLERRTVSRKTPGDGRLEITKKAAQQLERLGTTFVIEVGGESVTATLASFTCTCRGEAKPHEHYFLESERLKGLSAGSDVSLEVDEAVNRVVIRLRA